VDAGCLVRTRASKKFFDLKGLISGRRNVLRRKKKAGVELKYCCDDKRRGYSFA
jgi:hypothetical protein